MDVFSENEERDADTSHHPNTNQTINDPLTSQTDNTIDSASTPSTSSSDFTKVGKEEQQEEDFQSNHNSNNNNNDEAKEEDSTFDCHICLDKVNQPVLSLCGHLYCWPCIYEWLQRSPTCAVCKSALDTEKLVPLYGKGRDQSDPRKTIPSRPKGSRSEPPPHSQQRFPSPFDNNVSFSFGFLPLFGMATFQFGNGLHPGPVPNIRGNIARPQHQQNEVFVRFLLIVGVAVLFSILFQ